MSQKALYQGIGTKAASKPLGAVGNVFYVRGTGDNDNDGRTIDRPIITIKEALSRCVDERNDVIAVLDYWTPADEDWPIVVNKRRVHILGAAMGNLPSPAIVPADDNACFQFDAEGAYSEIAYLTIGGGGAHAGIELSVDGQAEGVYIHDCQFGHSWFGTPAHGIWLSPGGVRHTFGIRIEKCTFMGGEGNFVGALTAQGILESTGGGAYARDLEILNNVFKGCAVAVDLGMALDAVIKGNKFGINDAGGVDQGINLGAACLGCVVDKNSSGSRMATNSLATAYSDVAGGTANAWGLNYTGGVAVQAV